MFLVAASQAGISYSVAMGPLRKLGLFESNASRIIVAGLYTLRIAILLVLATLWALNHKRALFGTIIVANGYFTLGLLVDVISLMGVLGELHKAAPSLLTDAALMSLSNMLIFSIWYWVIDPPGIEGEQREEAAWAFLFPQRDGQLPQYENWSPGYLDYLFIGFTTNFAFSPTDALPLTRTAKMLMMTQGTISAVIVTGIAGGAINALVGNG
jgi:hypothetical protein